MPDVLGTAYIAIKTQDSGFESELKSKVAASAGRVKATVPVGAETKEAEAGFARLKAASSGVSSEVKSLGSSIAGIGPGTSALAGEFSKLGGVGKAGIAALNTEASGLKGVLGAAVPVAGALGVALVGFATQAVTKFISVALEVNKLKITLGTTAEDASRLRNVAVGLGVDVDTMGRAFFKLGPILTKSGGDLAGVHVEVEKNKDGTTNLVGTLDNMRKAYQSISDPIQKNTFLQEAFKKTGLDLRPVLAANDELFKRLAGNGPIIHQSDIDSAKQLAQAQRDLKQKFEDVQVAVAQKVVPAYEKADHAAFAAFNVAKAGFQILTGQAPAAAESIGKVSHAFDKQKDGAGAAKAKIDELAESTKKLTAENDKLAASQEKNLDASIRETKAVDAQTRAAEAVTKAHADAEAAVAKFGAASDEAKTAADAAKAADDTLTDSIVATAKAHRDATVASRDAQGATVSQKESTAILREELVRQADQLNGPQREAILAYIRKLDEIPADKQTTITADTSRATTNIAILKAQIASLGSANATVYAGAMETGGKLDYAAQGIKTRGPTLVGEGNPRFPEYVIATDPAYRARNLGLLDQATADLGGGAGGGGVTLNVSIVGSDPAEVTAEVMRALAWAAG